MQADEGTIFTIHPWGARKQASGAAEYDRLRPTAQPAKISGPMVKGMISNTY